MFILKVKDGFSLIELLVVIAIIGILAAVGTIGYGNYIESTQEKSTDANFDGIKRLVNTNVTIEGYENNSSEKCGDYVQKIVDDNNRGKKNPYDNGHDTIYVHGNCPTPGTPPNSTPQITQIWAGQVLIACQSPNSTSNKEVYVCACTADKATGKNTTCNDCQAQEQLCTNPNPLTP